MKRLFPREVTVFRLSVAEVAELLKRTPRGAFPAAQLRDVFADVEALKIAAEKWLKPEGENGAGSGQ